LLTEWLLPFNPVRDGAETLNNYRYTEGSGECNQKSFGVIIGKRFSADVSK
jgi:hypothetical protein